MKPQPASMFHPQLPPVRLIRDLVCILLVAGGMWASFPDANLWWLMVPALTVLVALVDRVRAGRALLYTLVVGMLFWCAHIHWVADATHVWFTVPLLSLTQALWWAVWAWLVSVARIWKWTRTPPGQALTYAVTWVGIEQARGIWPLSGFPWAQVAYSQVDSPLGHLAPWGGEVVVSAGAMVAAVMLRRAFSLAPGEDVQHWWSRPTMLLCALGIVFGPAAIPLPAGEQAGFLTVGVVQGNVEQPGDQTYQVRNKVLSNHARETDVLADAQKKVDVVIWGENSADRDPLQDSQAASILDATAARVDAPILVGRVSYNESAHTRMNWVGWWYPDGFSVPAGWDNNETYAKLIPVPFGEYIPWRGTRLGNYLATDVARLNYDMVPGDQDSVISVVLKDGRHIPMALGICFESAYERISMAGVQGGGQIIVIPTNNYHFNTTAESTQQAQMLRFRAMEFSRSAIQASTTGVSAVIRPDGSVMSMTGRQTAEYLVDSVPLRTSLTATARMGSWPAWIVMGATATFTVLTLGATILITSRTTINKERRPR